jgi:hypothetical protein
MFDMRVRRVLVGFLFVIASACGDDGGGGGGDDAGNGGDDGGGAIDAGGGCGLVTCESAGANCGPIGDGCGDVIQCGECDGEETCGGGGEPSVCGGASGCVPQTCEDVGANCGPIGDGCGGSIPSCGDCDGDEICGGGGPSVCGDPEPPCTGLCEDQVDCPTPGETTSVSGTVFTPAGDLPLYNIHVYVPNAPLDPIPTGNTSCEPCDAPLSGAPLVHTTTDAAGNFVLEDMPVGTDIPLVIQSGKWRRLVTIPSVAECVDTPVGAALTRFPRRQGEGGVVENNIPKIALTTGGADALECLIRKIGIADNQFTNPAGSGRVNLYAGTGGTDEYDSGVDFPNAQALWNDLDDLNDYDMVVLSCEGAGHNQGNRGPNALQAMKDYADLHGGRIFGSHWHHSWVELGPSPWDDIATYVSGGGAFGHGDDLPIPHTVDVNTAFPRGMRLAEWLVNVAASTVLGELELQAGQHTIGSVNPTMARAWMTTTNPNEGGAAGVPYFSFDTPVEAENADQCGRMVVTDIHVSNTDDSSSSFQFPSDGCTSDTLLPEEKALIFMLFDLASCVGSQNPECQPRDCADVGAECGPIADGCGELVDCGPCEEGEICGGDGPNQCGMNSCDPRSCEDVGAECGPIGDGCGEVVECGDCTDGEVCGGGGSPNQCDPEVE